MSVSLLVKSLWWACSSPASCSSISVGARACPSCANWSTTPPGSPLQLADVPVLQRSSKPYLDRSRFPELDELKNNWQTIREEALNLFDEGYIRAALNNNEAGFGSFFKKGWKRFYLTWYDGPLPSAQQLCPKTVELVSRIPNVKGAMFTLLPGGSHLNPHRDPSAARCAITSACPRRIRTTAASTSTASPTRGGMAKT